MTQTNYSDSAIHSDSLLKPVLLGATVALALIAIYLLGVDNPNPEWPTYWMVKPLLIVPIAGAMGGALYHFMDRYRSGGTVKKVFANLACLFAFIVFVWIGTIVGLDGTMWD